jgi:cytochrome c556
VEQGSGMGIGCNSKMASPDDDDASTPLVAGFSNEESGVAGPFYSADSVLEIPRSVAAGYFALITGGRMSVPDTTKGRNKLFKKRGRRGKREKRQGVDLEELTAGDDGTTSLDESSDELPDHLAISWMSILDGNVIDSCFGVTANGGARYTAMIKSGKRKGSLRQIIQDADRRSVNRVKKAKAQLAETADVHPAIKLLAIEAYGRCMRDVVEYHDNMKEYGILTPLFCSRNKMIRDRSQVTIREAFEHLTGAVEATL